MSTFIIKNVVKSYANDLTLIAATQIALFKKKLLYTWKKNILFATLFTNSDRLPISLRNCEKCQSQLESYNAVSQTCELVDRRFQEPTQPPKVCGPNGLESSSP